MINFLTSSLIGLVLWVLCHWWWKCTSNHQETSTWRVSLIIECCDKAKKYQSRLGLVNLLRGSFQFICSVSLIGKTPKLKGYIGSNPIRNKTLIIKWDIRMILEYNKFNDLMIRKSLRQTTNLLTLNKMRGKFSQLNL